MDEGAFGEREGLVPIGDSEGFCERSELATAAREEDVGRERFKVFEFFEGDGDAGEPDREAAFDCGGSLGDGGVGEFRVVVEVEFEKFGAARGQIKSF